ncbi:MAG: type II toxin-antitoxin system VapC family toxin [Blastocatellia bacterium]
MKVYVLDTSVVGFIEQSHPAVISRLQALPASDVVATSIVTIGETFNGWLSVCRRARGGAERLEAYSRMQKSFEFYRGMLCLPFDDIASAIFDQLMRRKIHIGANDLSIAAITLSVNGILVTRNIVDFQRISELVIEDWTKS